MNNETPDEVYNDKKDEVLNARQTHNGSYFYKLNQELSGQAEIGAYRVYGITEDHEPENDTLS